MLPEKAHAYRPARHTLTIHTIEAHTAGEPLRVVVGGFPRLHGESILDRRRYCLGHFDHIRTALMFEPRGHADMYGCILTEPVNVDSDFGVVFTHNEGYSTMCGHGIIAVTKVVLECGIIDIASKISVEIDHAGTDEPLLDSEARPSLGFPGAMPSSTANDPDELPSGSCPITIDTPAGTVYSIARVVRGRVESVSFRNVASFVDELNAHVEVDGLGVVRYDLAYGGAYYAYVRAADVGVTLDSDGYSELIEKGMAIKRAIMSTRTIRHPSEPDLGFLYGTIFIGDALDAANHSRNVCVFAEGEVDRSPTGTGVSGRAAIHAARGEIGDGETISIESIIGTTFTVSVAEHTRFGSMDAIIPIVTGSASLTGRSEFWIDHEDPLREGFILR